MITHYEMSTGEVLTTDGEASRLDWDTVSAAQPRLQTIEEAKSAESVVTAVIPADLAEVPAARILARFS
jgi:hypothetical protein